MYGVLTELVNHLNSVIDGKKIFIPIGLLLTAAQWEIWPTVGSLQKSRFKQIVAQKSDFKNFGHFFGYFSRRQNV